MWTPCLFWFVSNDYWWLSSLSFCTLTFDPVDLSYLVPDPDALLMCFAPLPHTPYHHSQTQLHTRPCGMEWGHANYNQIILDPVPYHGELVEWNGKHTLLYSRQFSTANTWVCIFDIQVCWKNAIFYVKFTIKINSQLVKHGMWNVLYLQW